VTSASVKTEDSSFVRLRKRSRISFQNFTESHASFIGRLGLKEKLVKHRGCVNTVQWNSMGTMLITGSDDCKLNVWNAENGYKLKCSLRSGHYRNIFSAKFVPGSCDQQVVSCGMDGEIHLIDFSRNSASSSNREINHQFSVLGTYSHMVFKLFFLPMSSSVFVTTHQDGCVRLFDLRDRTSGQQDEDHRPILVQLRNGRRIFSSNSLAFSPINHHQFVVGGSDPSLRLYDMRMNLMRTRTEADLAFSEQRDCQCICKYCPKAIFDSYDQSSNDHRFYITGVDYNQLDEVVATYSRDNVYLFNINPCFSFASSGSNQSTTSTNEHIRHDYKQQFVGRRNISTFLKEVQFLGGNQYVGTGSDCGNLFIWEKASGCLVQLLEADESVVNGIAPHPLGLPILATCGIDSDAKIFEPFDHYTFDQKRAVSVMEKNIQFIEEPEEPSMISFSQLIEFLTRLGYRYNIRTEENEGEEDATEISSNNSAAAANIDDNSENINNNNNNNKDDIEDKESNRNTTDIKHANQNRPSEAKNVEKFLLEIQNTLHLCNSIRNQANELFKKGDFIGAIRLYDDALEKISNGILLLCHDCDQKLDELRSNLMQSKLFCLINKAACFLKTENYTEVVEVCSQALQIDVTNIKALVRRGIAYSHLNQLDLARSDLQMAHRHAPDDLIISKALQDIKERDLRPLAVIVSVLPITT